MDYKYKWLLFDADGTLFDYDKAEQFSINKALIDGGIDTNTIIIEKYRQINHYLWGELEKGNIDSIKLRVERFKLLLNEFNLKNNPEEISSKYLENLSQTDFLIEGAVDILDSLNGDLKMAIITNGIKYVQQGRLKKTGFNKYFKEIIISEDVKVSKPDKKFFDYTLNKINFDKKDEILIIGDSLSSDIQGGINSGIDTCWFNPNKNGNILSVKPKYEIEKLSEITNIISKN